MPQLIPVQLDDETVIYIEATDDVDIPAVSEEESLESDEESVVDKSGRIVKAQKQMTQSFHAIQGTIRAYTTHTLNALKTITSANINKVTLEFGIELGGEAGVPFVTKGTAKSNLKITVECSFPEVSKQQPQPNQGTSN